MIVTVSEAFAASKNPAILGVLDRDLFLTYLRRAVELAAYKANYQVWLGELDVCSNQCGYVTLPSFVGTVLQVNVGGAPTIFRNPWYGYHVNGLGMQNCGPSIGFSDDLGFSPTFQDLKEWSRIAAICEDPIDGNGTLEMVVQGETMDGNNNPKMAITIPVSGPSSSGVKIPLMLNWASTDKQFTWFKKITQVTKPVTRGYVKLIGFPQYTMASAVTLGYYAPNETNPIYRRVRVGCACNWVRIKYRRASLALVDDWDIVPISSLQAILELIKSIRLADANDIQGAEAYLARAVRLLNEVESITNGSTWSPLQFEPGWGVSTLDWR